MSFFQEGEIHQDVYDTILFAIGRRALTAELKPENVGLKLVEETGKIDAINEQTNIPNIFAVGDVLHVSSSSAFNHLLDFNIEQFSNFEEIF